MTGVTSNCWNTIHYVDVWCNTTIILFVILLIQLDYYNFLKSFLDHIHCHNSQSVSFDCKSSRVKPANLIAIPSQRLLCCHREVVSRLLNKNTTGILRNPILISSKVTALPPWDNVSLTDLVVRNHSVDEAGSQIWQRPDQHWSLVAGGHKGTGGRRGVYILQPEVHNLIFYFFFFTKSSLFLGVS